MSQSTILDRDRVAPRRAEESLARIGTLGVVAAGLMAMLVFML